MTGPIAKCALTSGWFCTWQMSQGHDELVTSLERTCLAIMGGGIFWSLLSDKIGRYVQGLWTADACFHASNPCVVPLVS